MLAASRVDVEAPSAYHYAELHRPRLPDGNARVAVRISCEPRLPTPNAQALAGDIYG
jgi:hypothetical protein